MKTLPAALPLSGFLALVVALNMSSQAWPAAALMALLACFALAVGFGIARLARLDIPAELALLLGMAVVLHAMGIAGLVLRSHLVFGLIAILPLALLGGSRLHRPLAPGMSLVLLAVLAFTLAWTLESSARFATFAQDGVMRLWLDFFIHALTIGEQGEMRMAPRLSGALADVRPGFYHFASFALPALFVNVLGLSPIETAALLWLPIGVALMSLALAALGRELAGVAGAALALILLAAVPEGALYGLGHGVLSFHWLVETAPGTGYGAAFGLLSLALLVRHEREGGWALIALSALAMAAVVMTRAHIFIWLAPAWAGAVVLASSLIPARARWPLLLFGAAVALGGMLWMVLPEFSREGYVTVASRYLDSLRQQDGRPAFMGLARVLHERLPAIISLPALAMLAQIAVSTGLVLALIALCGFAARRRLLRPMDALPFLLLAWGAAVILLAPTAANGDASEWRHRAFPIMVLVLMAWVAALLLRLLPRLGRPTLLGVGACLASLVTWQYAATWKRPLPPWTVSFISRTVSPAIRNAAHWLRDEVQPGQIFTMARLDRSATLVEPAVELAALSGVPAFASRAALYAQLGGRHAAAIAARVALLDQVAAMDRAEALTRLREAGVDFYVVQDDGAPPWAAAPAPAAYRAPGIAIFTTKQTN